LTTGSLTIGGSSILRFDLATQGAVGGAANDLLTVNGPLTLDGTLVVTELPGFSNGTYRLFNYTGALTNNGLDLQTAFLTAHPGSTINLGTAGQVNLIVVPEPSTATLLALGAALLRGSRRKRGYDMYAADWRLRRVSGR
jgi:hypothetical protein